MIDARRVRGRSARWPGVRRIMACPRWRPSTRPDGIDGHPRAKRGLARRVGRARPELSVDTDERANYGARREAQACAEQQARHRARGGLGGWWPGRRGRHPFGWVGQRFRQKGAMPFIATAGPAMRSRATLPKSTRLPARTASSSALSGSLPQRLVSVDATFEADEPALHFEEREHARAEPDCPSPCASAGQNGELEAESPRRRLTAPIPSVVPVAHGREGRGEHGDGEATGVGAARRARAQGLEQAAALAAWE